MNATRKYIGEEEKRSNGLDQHYTLDVSGLAEYLSCGISTARKIGEESGAKIKIGRRTLYLRNKVQQYLDSKTVSA